MRYTALLLAGLTAGMWAAPASATGPLSTRGPSLLDTYAGSTRQFLASESTRSTPAAVAAVPADIQTEVQSNGTRAVSGDRKSPTKAFFLSLLLPGLGEAYAGNYLRAGVFLGIEAVGWTAWGIYDGKGKSKRDEFIAIQAEHWSFDRYDAYRNAVWSKSGVGLSQQDSLSVLGGTHHYDAIAGRPQPKVDDQYEMIGKYHRFVYGWDDATHPIEGDLLSTHFPQPPAGETWGKVKEDWLSNVSNLVTPDFTAGTDIYQVQFLDQAQSANRDRYMEIRRESNDYHSTAKKFTTVIMFNHIASAIHAARLTSRMNSTGAYEEPQTSIGMMMVPGRSELVPTLTVQRRF